VGLFSSRHKRDATGQPSDLTGADSDSAVDGKGDGKGATDSSPVVVPSGPYDAADAPSDLQLIDFGAIRLPLKQGVRFSAEVSKANGSPVSISLSQDGSRIQFQAFAAPKTRGIWDEVRSEIASSIGKQAGSCREVTSRFGKALVIELPVTTAQGRKGKQPLRVIGVDGPRWMLRGTISGRAARDQVAADALEELFASAVVVRGSAAMAPREPLPLRLPGSGLETDPADTEDPMALLRRGPEINEVR
jgi:hypothetical protein